MKKTERRTIRAAIAMSMLATPIFFAATNDRAAAEPAPVVHATEHVRSTPNTEPAPPESVPSESTPSESIPTTTQPEESTTSDGSTNVDPDDADPLAVALASIGFAILLGAAAWWMLRRDDPDALPHSGPDDGPGWPGDRVV